MIRSSKVLTLALTTVIAGASLVACKQEPGARAPAQTNEPAAQPAAASGHKFDPADRFKLTGAAVKGSEQALVTIIEFSDFECPFCSRVNPTLAKIMETYPNDVRIVFKHSPLPFHQNAPLAHEASLAAHEQGKFWEYHDKLFANIKDLQRPTLDRYAQELGLDMAKFQAAMDARKFKAQVEADLAVARENNIQGTPNFLVNGQAVTGAQPFENFDKVIKEELEAAKKLQAAGKSQGEILAARFDENLKKNQAAAQQQQRQQPAQPDPAAEMFVPVGASPTKGPNDALVTIAILSEFQCPFCARVKPTLDQIESTYGKDVRFVFKHLPLDFHNRAEPAAMASWAAQQQGKFWEYHDKVFQNQRALEDADLLRYAEELGLNLDKFKADMASDGARKQVDEDKALAGRLAARGTPHFFINGIRLRGAQPFEQFKAVIDKQLEEANKLIAAGTPRAKIYDELQKDAIKGNAPMIQPAGGGDAQQPEARPAPVKIDIGKSPTKGPANAPVTIVEWSEFQCPFCMRFTNNLNEALKGYEDKVQVVFKQYPLPFHQQADLAGQASLAAHAQGKFWEYHDRLWQDTKALSRPDLERYAQELGLNMDQFRKDLDNGTYAAQVKEEMAEGSKLGVQGTPTWFVNGVRFSGALPPDAIRAEIERALKESEKK